MNFLRISGSSSIFHDNCLGLRRTFDNMPLNRPLSKSIQNSNPKNIWVILLLRKMGSSNGKGNQFIFIPPGQWIISQVHYYQAHGWEHGGHSVKVKAMLLVAIIHFHCAPHSLSSHWYPIPNFCNSFIGSISTPFIHLNFNKLLHSIIVILQCCFSMMESTLMTVHRNKISIWICFFGMECLLHDFWILMLFITRKITEDQMLQKGWIISLVTVPSPSPLSICKKFIQLNNYHKLYTKHPDVTIDNWEGSRRIII